MEPEGLKGAPKLAPHYMESKRFKGSQNCALIMPRDVRPMLEIAISVLRCREVHMSKVVSYQKFLLTSPKL